MGRNSKDNSNGRLKCVTKIIGTYSQMLERYLGSEVLYTPSINISSISENSVFDQYKEYIDKVEQSIELLDGVSRFIFKHEFIYRKTPYWWMSIYSKSTFYRLKDKAIRAFLENFKNAN